MGGGSKTTKQEMPQFQQDYLQQTVLPFAQTVANTEFTPYAGSFAPEMSGFTSQAGGLFGQMANTASMTPADYQGVINQNLAGFQGNVIDPTMAAMERRFAQERVGEQGNVIGSGAFDSSRRAVFEGEREASRDVAMAQTMADLQRQGYDAAAAQTMAQLAAQQAGQSGAASGLMGVGATEMGLGATQLEGQYGEFMRQEQDPYQRLSALTGGAGAIPGGYGATTESKKPGLFDYLTLGATAASAFASDIRLKTNIRSAGKIGNVNLYEWDWNDEGKRVADPAQPTFGVMAQELQETHPQHVQIGPDGFMRVDYKGLAAELEAA